MSFELIEANFLLAIPHQPSTEAVVRASDSISLRLILVVPPSLTILFAIGLSFASSVKKLSTPLTAFERLPFKAMTTLER